MSETIEDGAVTQHGDDRPEPGETRTGSTGDWLRGGLILVVLVALSVRYPIPMLVIGAFFFCIFLHELGHYVTAKRAGMKVTEFFIGFGPRLWSFRRGETEYGIKPIPAGAYVKIIGMSNLEEVDPAEEHRTYRQKPYWRRLSVAVAGSTMHFIIAIVLMFSVLVGFGQQERDSENWTVGGLSGLEGGPSPAEEAGLEVGDRIVSVDGQTFDDFFETREYLLDNPNREVTLVVERDGERLTRTVTLAANEAGEGEVTGFLGVVPQFPTERADPLTGAVESVKETGSAMVMSVKAIGSFFSPTGITGYFSTLSGDASPAGEGEIEGGENRFLSPVGAVNLASQAADSGWVNLVVLLFFINVFIGVINLFPMLPFDGGHVVIATYERIRSRNGQRYFADITKLMPFAYMVFIILIFIGVSSLYLDISNPIQIF